MKKVKLITETSHDIKLIESNGVNGKELFIEGIFSTAELKNNNKRRYKKSILEREVLNIQKKVSSSSLWGELGHPPCIFGDNEILTSKGWKRIDSISDNEIVATLNKDTEEIEYHSIDKKIISDYKGDMYRFKNRQINMSFTPTHRHLTVDRYGKYTFNNSKEIGECKTRRFTKSYIPKTGKWTGIVQDTITLKGIPHIPHSKYDYESDIELDLSIFMGFLGIYLSEGCVTKDSKNRINIFQKEGSSADLIRDLLYKFPKELNWDENNNNGMITFSLSDSRLANILKPLGNCYDKYIPEEYKQFDSRYLYELLYWFGIRDGSGFITEDPKRDVFTSSEKLINDLNEIAFKCGISTRKRTYICETDYKIEDRIIKSENRAPLYILQLLTSKGVYLDNRFMDISKEYYDGKVYCVQVKNHNFYVRNENSASFWTGNSPEINLDKIAIKIESLQWKGANLIGKAKVLDTPQGNIAKVLIKEGSLGISSRGLGTVGDDGYVNSDFNLITWDLVADPSNNPSWVNGIYEGKSFAVIDDDEIKKDDEEVVVDTITEEEAKKEFSKYINDSLDKIIKDL